jgi:hypothetical protein
MRQNKEALVRHAFETCHSLSGPRFNIFRNDSREVFFVVQEALCTSKPTSCERIIDPWLGCSQKRRRLADFSDNASSSIRVFWIGIHQHSFFLKRTDFDGCIPWPSTITSLEQLSTGLRWSPAGEFRTSLTPPASCLYLEALLKLVFF